jgi:hypothetical protein
MSGYARDYVFWAAVTIICLLHIDAWAWDKIHPMVFGWIPYHLWYDGVLTLFGAAFFTWWGARMWPEPPDDTDL